MSESPKCVMQSPPPLPATEAEPLGRDAIFAVDDQSIQPLEVPEWGGTVYLRVMTGEERDEYENGMVNPATGKLTKRDNFRARLAVIVLCNEDGERLFTPGDVGKICKKGGKALDRIFAAGTKLNGMTEDDVKEIKGNSESGQSEDSGSA